MTKEYDNFKLRKEAVSEWIRPWDVETFSDMQRDTRFFSILTKGLLSFLDSTIRLYGKPVRHFIIHTGKEYLYQESNGYEFSWTETTGEDMPYLHKPRGVVSWEEVSIDTARLSSPYSAGFYERPVKKYEMPESIGEFSAQIRILPIAVPVNVTYVLSNFNESLVMTEQLLNRFAFTRYFSIAYLGRPVTCSVEFPESLTPAKTVKLGYNSDSKDRELEIKLDLKTVFPVIIESTEMDASKVISAWNSDIKIE